MTADWAGAAEQAVLEVQERRWRDHGSSAEDAWPTHYRDDDGPLCDWSGVARSDPAAACPRGCAGSLEHFENDGHPGCGS